MNHRSQATRERLLAAAEECLAQKGADTTMEEIAKRAETSRMTAYRHFESRDHLLLTVIARGWVELSVELRAVFEKTPGLKGQLTEGLPFLCEAIRSRPHLAWTLSPATLGTRWDHVDPDRQFVRVVEAFMEPYFREAERESQLRAEVPDAIEWVQRQVLLLLTLPLNRGESIEEIRRQVETFIVPSVLKDP